MSAEGKTSGAGNVDSSGPGEKIEAREVLRFELADRLSPKSLALLEMAGMNKLRLDREYPDPGPQNMGK